MDIDEQFSRFVTANSASLLHTARLLTGDYHRGEDLCQSVLARLYLRWKKIDQPLAYARTALVRAHIDTTRRRWTTEQVTDELPEQPDHTGIGSVSDDRDELRRLLTTLSPRERAVVVLRYYCDLSEQDTAATLGMAVGTVKSTCSRALARLRVDARAAS